MDETRPVDGLLNGVQKPVVGAQPKIRRQDAVSAQFEGNLGGTSGAQASLPTPFDGSDRVLRQALVYQREAHRSGKPLKLTQILEKHAELAGDKEAELKLAYQTWMLTEPHSSRSAVLEEILSEHPQLAEPLQRQVTFSEQLAGNSPARRGRSTEKGSADSPSTELELPEVIGRFEIRSCVGQGGMGTVYEAWDTRLAREVAIKVPRANPKLSKTRPRSLIREARIAAQLSHPNLAEIYDLFDHSGTICLVSRWADCGNLEEVIATREEPLTEADVLWLMTQIAAGLDHCHRRNVNHLDLKPGNILFTTDQDSEANVPASLPGIPLIADFGIAQQNNEWQTVSFSHTGVGTPMYMAPEQIDGGIGPIGPAADVFACGLLLQELLEGTHPLANHSITDALNALRVGQIPGPSKSVQVSSETRTILKNCLQESPSCRYQTAGELLADLKRAQSGQTIRKHQSGLLQRTKDFSKRPESIDQAAYICLGINFSLLMSFGLILVSMLLQVWSNFTGDLWAYVLDVMKLVAFPHGPMILTSLLVLKGRRSLHVLNVAFAAILAGMVTYSLVTGDSPLRIYEGHPFAFKFLHITVLSFSVGMLGTHLLAVPAWLRRNKSRRS
ncbi:MAG: serine/threonine-protein kinase [Pirellulaceae bacterium]